MSQEAELVTATAMRIYKLTTVPVISIRNVTAVEI
jgi:hypothetical protein